jgi:peptide/nickel transport system ATP-binding protein
MSTILNVSGLGVEYGTESGTLPSIEDVSFTIETGEALGLTGEAGSGKSVVGRAILRANGARAQLRGQVLFQGTDLLTFSAIQLDATRGNEIGFVPQDPMSELDPDMKIGDQIAQTLVVHIGMGMDVARKMAIEALHELGIAAPKDRAQAYPAELTHGERQRAVVARALVCEPRLLIADEPASNMDGGEREHLIEHLHRQRERRHMALLLISRDMALVSDLCDSLVVMQAGLMVEQGRVADLLEAPRHPYTAAYIAGAARSSSGKGSSDNSLRLRQLPGCRYVERCARADAACRAALPGWTPEPGSAGYRCVHPLVERIA